MELSELPLRPRYRTILESCEPFLVTNPGNLGELDLAPFGVPIPEERRYAATRLASRDVVDGLHYLDAATFGGQDMLMPRWVLFDCGEFPGIVFGFGRRAAALPPNVRQYYHVEDRDDVFVPLSMWVAIRCAERASWFGHNLSSANVLFGEDAAMGGLATVTKVLGVKLTRARRQYGATQWKSASIGLHLRLGDMRLLSAYTPAHTHPETFAYCIDVEDEVLVRGLRSDWSPAAPRDGRVIEANDSKGIRALHDQIEAGAHLRLVHAERRGAEPSRLWLAGDQ